MSKRKFAARLALVAIMLIALVPSVSLPTVSAQTISCAVTYNIPNDWGAGFTADVTIKNNGTAAINGWTLRWTFGGNQTITNLWNGSYTQSGTAVAVTNLSYNATIGANGGTVNFGFNANYSGTNAKPTSFTVNGTACGGVTPTNTPTTTGPTPTRTPTTTGPTPTRTPTTGGPTPTRTPTSSVPTSTPTRTPTTGGPTSTPTRTPTQGGTCNATHVANPFSGATWYVNQNWQGRSRYNVNTAVWIDRIAAISGGSGSCTFPSLTSHLDAALAQGANLIILIVYDLPNRDCAASASNGELLISQDGLNRYKTEYIDPIYNILSQSKYCNLRIVTVIEPDSLPNLVTNLSIAACSEANSSGAYVQGVQYAINKLHSLPNVYEYVDIAHSGWLGWDSNFGPAADVIANAIKGTTAGVNSIDGFVSNTANYTPWEEPFLTDSNASVGGQQIKSATFYEYNPYLDEHDFAGAMYSAFVSRGFPSSIGMLVDTSRNGWGGSSYGRSRPTSASTSTDLNTYVNASRIDRRYHRGNWCNQAGGIGARPAASPASNFDAFVWIKPPGESDGISQSGVTDPCDPNKKHDVMCDPNGQSRYNSAYSTGALAGAPHAGQWFQSAFDTLVANQYP